MLTSLTSLTSNFHESRAFLEKGLQVHAIACNIFICG